MKTRSRFPDYDTNLLEIIKQNIELNDGVCISESIQIQQFDWKKFHSDQIDDRIEIIIAADGISFPFSIYCLFVII